jgi:hypothetical protein
MFHILPFIKFSTAELSLHGPQFGPKGHVLPSRVVDVLGVTHGRRRDVGQAVKRAEIRFHFEFEPFLARDQKEQKEAKDNQPHVILVGKLKGAEGLGRFRHGVPRSTQNGAEKRFLGAQQGVQPEPVGARRAPRNGGGLVERAEKHDGGEAAKGKIFVGEVSGEYNKAEFDGGALEDCGAKEEAEEQEADNDFREAHIVDEYIFFNELNICN